MAEKIVIDIFRKKSIEELAASLSDAHSKLETGSAAACTAAMSASLFCRAAAVTAEKLGGSERLEYICRNAGILRDYMVHLIDEDVKSRGPLKKAMLDGDERAIEAARQPAVSISGEIINMMIKQMELCSELSELCPRESMHYLAESAELALAAARAAMHYISDMAEYCSDEVYRYVSRRENQLLLEQLEPLVKALTEKAI